MALAWGVNALWGQCQGWRQGHTPHSAPLMDINLVSTFLNCSFYPQAGEKMLALGFQQRACSSWFLAPEALCHIVEAVLMPTHATLGFITAAVTQEL